MADEMALLDSGATENFIDHKTVTHLCLRTKKLDAPRPVFNVDGTLNRHGTITHACDLIILRGHKQEQQRFFVTNLGKDCFIFGYPWFRSFSPDIDWPEARLKGPKVQVETIFYGKLKRAQHILKEEKE